VRHIETAMLQHPAENGILKKSEKISGGESAFFLFVASSRRSSALVFHLRHTAR